MNKRCKVILIFSFAFWGAVLVSLLLMSFAFGRIPIGLYGLREFYWTSVIDDGTYTSGVYHRGLSTQFVTYPATIQYIVYSQNSTNGVLRLVSSDSQPFTLEYTAAYRIIKSSLKTTYKTYANNYIPLLKSAINNKILQITASLTSDQLWKSSTEDSINTALYNLFTTNNSLFGVELHAFWLGDIRFSNLEDYYSNSYLDSSSSSTAYASSQYDLMNTNIQISLLNSTIYNKINELKYTLNDTYQTAYQAIVKTTSNNITYFNNMSTKPQLTKYLAYHNFTKIEFV